MKDIRKTHLKIVSGLLRYTSDYFHKNNFTQLMPIILSSVTDPLGPDPGSTVIKTGEIDYLGQRLSLTQSMILHKQIAIKEGIEKLFIISPNVRLEDPKRRDSGKHLFEFSQVDFEIAHGTKEDVFRLMEGFLKGAIDYTKTFHSEELDLLDRHLSTIDGPFKRYTTYELKDKYGEDWEYLASTETKQPFWVLDHSREFYDKEDPDRPGHYVNYDMVYPEGFCEGLSGAEREYEYDTIIKKIDKHGLDKTRYEPYLELAKTGLVPSAGGGFGVERLARYVTGAKHIGDVQLFRRVPGEPIVV
ncbi:MAG: asparagine synthetase A [Candidatus Micrarchaeota archaeon]